MSSMKQKGPAKTTPTHGKRVENRLYSKYQRGKDAKTREDGGINPDGTIEVATVCGTVVSVYDKVKHGRRRLDRFIAPNHGAAVLWATEHDENQRAARARMQG